MTAIAQYNLTPFANFQYEDCMGHRANIASDESRFFSLKARVDGDVYALIQAWAVDGVAPALRAFLLGQANGVHPCIAE